jgi:chaperonin GroEL
VDAVADTIKITLGPVCQNVLISNPPLGPVVTNDGVSIARSIQLPGEYENMGAQLIVEAAAEASRWAGDGTTTATVLAQGMLTAGLRNVAAGANPMMVRRGIQLAAAALSDELARLARPARDEGTLAQVGVVAANHPGLGRLAAQAVLATRPDGGVTVEQGPGVESRIRYSEGITWDRGFISSAFVNTPSNRVELEHPYVLITDRKLSDFDSMRPFFQLLAAAGVKSLFVTCDRTEGSALAAFVAATTGGDMQVALVRAPAIGRRRSEICEDLAIATGARFVSSILNQDWSTITLDMLGRAESIVVSAEAFVIIGPKGDASRVSARLASIRSEAGRVSRGFNARRLAERARRMSGDVAVLEIAAPTAFERREVRQRATNAVFSCQAAYESGVLPGGGAALVRARLALDHLDVTGDLAVGVDIVRRSVARPLAQIASTAGVDGDYAVEELEALDDPGMGFNALTRRFENLLEAGIVDPLSVVQSSLRSAASVAATILTTETAVKFTPEPSDVGGRGEPGDDGDQRPVRWKTRVLVGEPGKHALLRGAQTLADVVSTTHGPRGLSVMLGRKSPIGSRTPVVSRDGAAVAREINLPNTAENIGAQLLREAAFRTETMVGDGTTTATVLAQAVLHEAHRQIAAGRNAMSLRNGLQLAGAYVDAFLRERARSISTFEEIEWIARVSSGDARIASAVAAAFDRVGHLGAVEVRRGTGLDLTCDFVDGLRIDAGLHSPFFMTDPQRAQTVLEEPYVLVLTGSGLPVAAIARLLALVRDAGGKNILVIASKFPGEMLGFLAANWDRGAVRTCPVQASYSRALQHEILLDVAAATGATPISSEAEATWESETLNVFGRAARAVASPEHTTIVGGFPGPAALAHRGRQVEGQLDREKQPRLREALARRVFYLSGKVALLDVGAATGVELQSRLQLTDDAVRAARAALEDGVVPGGGTAYLQARRSLPEYSDQSDTAVGVSILRKALVEPFRSIVANSGADPGEVLARVDSMPFGHGYDVARGEFVDLLESGIVDPVKVAQQALRSAISVAISLITTDSVVALVPPPSSGIIEVDAVMYARMLADDPSVDWGR